MTSLPPLPGDLQLISIGTIKAALAKMDIKIPVDDIITVICEVEEAKRAERRAVLCKRKWSATAACLLSFNLSNVLVALDQEQFLSLGSKFTTTSYFVQDPPRAERPTPLAKER